MRRARGSATLPTEPRFTMPKYVIERDIPAIGQFTPAQLSEASRKSCNVLHQLAPRVQWVQSYVTADKLYCVYIAANEEAVREHARLGGFPATRVSAVKTIIDPTTGGD
jgi:hypothetical protein